MKKIFLLFLVFNKMLLYAQTPVDSVKIIFESDILLAQVTATPKLILLSAAGDTLSNRTVTWSSLNPEIASVNSDGLVTAVSKGNTTIMATVEGKTGQASLIVESREQYDSPWVTFGMDNDIRQPIQDQNGRFVPNPADNRKQIVVDETFTVPQGQEVKWENSIVFVKAKKRGWLNIYGKLYIYNSSIFFQQVESRGNRLDIMNGGSLTIINSYAMSSDGLELNWEYEDGSTVYLNHFQSQAWASPHGSINYKSINGSTAWMTIFNTVHDATIDISDSHNVWLELGPPAGTHEVSLPPINVWANFEPPSLWPKTSIKIKNSRIVNRDISIENGINLTIKDTPSGVGCGWGITKLDQGFITCVLRDLGAPNDTSGTYYANKTWSLPQVNSSITLINSRLLSCWPTAMGNVHLIVYSSHLADPSSTGPATLEFYDSYMDQVSGWVGGSNEGAKIYLENSTVRNYLEVNGAGSMIYGYGVKQKGPTKYQVFEENGGKYIELKKALTATNISLTSGNSQSAYTGLTLRVPLTVTVSDSVGFLRAGTSVKFEIASFPIGATGQNLSSQSVITDSAGIASTILTLGSVEGTYKVTATAPGLIGSPVTFIEIANNSTITTAYTYALSFGGNAIAIAPYSEHLKLGTAFTIEAWLYLVSAVSDPIVVGNSYDNGNVNYALRINNNNQPELIQTLGAQGTGVSALGPIPLPKMTWTLLTGKLENGILSLFVNGNQVASTSSPGIPVSGNIPFSIGAGMGSEGSINWGGFNGVLSNVRVWNRALSDSEIISHFTQKILTGNESGLIACWPLNDGSGQIAIDIGVNHLDLNLGTSPGVDSYDPKWVLTSDLPTDVNSAEIIPSKYELMQNYPNPFNPSTIIQYEIPRLGHVELKVYDILGREVSTLVNEIKEPGKYEVKFDGSKLSSGVYFYCLKANSFIETNKFVLMK